MRESWTALAACRERPDLMTAPFAEAADRVVRRRAEWAAKAVCTGCPVLIECRWWALRNEVAGVCGGFTESEREALRRFLGVQVVPCASLPFLPVDVRCRDSLDSGVSPRLVARWLERRGWTRRAAARQVASRQPVPASPASEGARRLREATDEMTG